MADATTEKKQKLANTKKRFKELQELKKKRNENQTQHESDPNIHSTESSSRNTPLDLQAGTRETPTIESDVPQTPSPFLALKSEKETANSTPNIENPLSNNPAQNALDNQPVALPNYFDASNSQTTEEFFDNLSAQNTSNTENPVNLMNYFKDSEDFVEIESNDNENIGKARYFDNQNNSALIWENTVLQEGNKSPEDYSLFSTNSKNGNTSYNNKDAVSMDYPEIKQNEISECARKKSKNVDVKPSDSLPTYFKCAADDVLSPADNQKLMDYFGSTGATEEEKADILHINDEIDDSTNTTKKEVKYSNVESLKQLSNQLAKMIEPYDQYTTVSSTTDLEKRNLELADCLEKEKVTSEQLKTVNQQLQERISQLQADLVQKESEATLHNAQEVAYLKNELQSHLQTIGLLVAEKTELSSNLNQYELTSKQKNAECEELQARLKASRSRVADLEKELNNLKTEKSKSESMGEQYSASFDNLRKEYKIIKEQKDELAQDLLEVREKLKNSQEDNLNLQQINKELSSKYSLAEIKIQQLSAGGSSGVDRHVEELSQQKIVLEGDISNLNQMLKSIIRERDEMTIQYQQYTQQLNAQISNLSSKLEQLQHEKENLLRQEQNRIKHIGELERQLQHLQNDQVAFVTGSFNNTDLKNEIEKAKEMCVQLQIDKTTAEENYTKICNEKELLLKELNAKTDSISQMESIIEQLKGNQPDSVKLLATMESDKVAASRAIQQNKELKQQLDSMQEVVLKMDNDKVILTENFKGQQQTNKELIEKLQRTELTLQSLADAIEIKDKELTHLREALEEITRQELHKEQLEDRWRHYEAHDNSAHIVQLELQEAKQTITALTNELNKRENQKVQRAGGENNDLENELVNAKRRIAELTNDINRLKSLESSNMDEKTLEIGKELDVDEEESSRNKNILNKENAMKYLEEKVKRTMQEIADLSDEKQRLEHIVLQLQSETETIGEYVALYQHQRMILKQKALEKDQQLKQLANDREQIKIKLERLNQLITKLVNEKGALPAELLQQHEETKNLHDFNVVDHATINDHGSKEVPENLSNVIEPQAEKDSPKTGQTAQEIISLLSEIKTSNLVQPDENYHHCPWCSGQLITV